MLRNDRAKRPWTVFVQDTAGSGRGAADELSTLAQLRDRGVITEAEITQQKARVLA